jgi:hypothetical protein
MRDDYDGGDTHSFWICNACGAQNSEIDGECQFCECGGIDCKRDSCSAVEHFHAEHAEPVAECEACRNGDPTSHPTCDFEAGDGTIPPCPLPYGHAGNHQAQDPRDLRETAARRTFASERAQNRGVR